MERVFSLFWIRRHSLVGEASDAFSLTIRRSSNKTSNHHQGISTAHTYYTTPPHMWAYISVRTPPQNKSVSVRMGQRYHIYLRVRLIGWVAEAASLMDRESEIIFSLLWIFAWESDFWGGGGVETSHKCTSIEISYQQVHNHKFVCTGVKWSSCVHHVRIVQTCNHRIVYRKHKKCISRIIIENKELLLGLWDRQQRHT